MADKLAEIVFFSFKRQYVKGCWFDHFTSEQINATTQRNMGPDWKLVFKKFRRFKFTLLDQDFPTFHLLTFCQIEKISRTSILNL